MWINLFIYKDLKFPVEVGVEFEDSFDGDDLLGDVVLGLE